MGESKNLRYWKIRSFNWLIRTCDCLLRPPFLFCVFSFQCKLLQLVLLCATCISFPIRDRLWLLLRRLHSAPCNRLSEDWKCIIKLLFFPPVSISLLFGGWYLHELMGFTSSAFHHDNSSLFCSKLPRGWRSLPFNRVFSCLSFCEIALWASTGRPNEKVLCAPLCFVLIS